MNETNVQIIDRVRLLKATEVAAILNISRSHVYQLMKLGEIRTVHIGSAKRIRLKDLLLYIEDSINPPSIE